MNDSVSHTALASHCLDCGAGVDGRYCANCGQSTRQHVPSLREFAHEFIGHYVALEGALFATLRLLVLRPGQLSRDFLDGRRTRHIQPLRLYLTISLLFFALMKLAAPAPAVGHGTEAGPARAHAAAVAGAADADGVSFETWFRAHMPSMAARADHFDLASDAEKRAMIGTGFYKYGPYGLFLTLPLCALFLKLLYWRSRYYYGEHLVFAMHFYSFALCIIAAIMLVPSTLAATGLACWLGAYLPLAMRRTYDLGWIATLPRAALLMGMQLSALVLAIAAVAALTVVA